METSEDPQPPEITARMRKLVEWPQGLGYGWLATCGVILVVIIIGVVNVVSGAQDGAITTVVGSIAIALLLCVVAGGMLRKSGFRWVKPSRRLSVRQTAHGPGIVVPTGRLVLLLVSSLTFTAVFGLTAFVTWRLGIGESLLPASRDSSAGANFMGIVGGLALLLAVFFLGFRSPPILEITPSGVAYRVRRHRGFSVTKVEDFAAWSDITAIDPETDTVQTGQYEVRNPLLRLTYRATGSTDTTLAPDRDFLIRVYLLVVEPNTLYSLMRHMREHPEDRELLGREDAIRLLTPPPLRERFRVAREMKKAKKSERSGASSNA